MRVFLVFLLFLGFVFGEDLPFKTIQTQANVMSMTLVNDNLYIATYSGSIEIYDVKNDTFKQSIVFDDIKNINDEILRPNILSIDELNGSLLVLAEANSNKRSLYLVKDSGIKLVSQLGESAKKALFLSENEAILGTISNEISIINLQNGKSEHDFKISTALLADMKANPSKTTVAIATEGGKIYFYDVKSRDMSRIVDVHKDTMYAIDYDGNVVLTAGVDMSVAVLRGNEIRRLKAKTSVMDIALSTDAKTGAYIQDDLSEIYVFDTNSLTQVKRLQTPQNTINSIVFISPDMLLSSAFEKNIHFWKVR
ncbi:nitrate reductase [Campylobacter sp. RM13119]|uniref:WD40 repeat domain-containing protein n=1 Tax=Campylobacter TaxID=194 RepID=UPI001474DDB3|nr:nitrate reductase [Campylobacter sp. RM13119]MBE3022429.1 nitrate reductase [Campylobacter sp. 7477a]MBE3606517.1 nitrate reductase [Campylobacter sp. RM13119]